MSKLLLKNCVQAHDNCLEVLPHINLYLSTRRLRTIESPGHIKRKSQFFEILYFQEFCISRPGHFLQKLTKNKFAGLRPAPVTYGGAPLPPTKVGANCLAAVVLAHHDHVLCDLALVLRGIRRGGSQDAIQWPRMRLYGPGLV